ncbi:FUSC family protein [Luteimicrobium subarcticum]|uniref:Uncharacterized membrane protein YgaE (UPF0421/DUF939 family) n=1 Tax=Luteimicrobium subarcticum TaxID=620910 RepID=A0A2M8WVY9_9MICO|nr:FUSC family protein [Luteimicrobium subarcticum]PJI95089.1 uncharacterized membrane protein YgaE (UPF0421/DUF939 family) [Luteimicrobium subarcticum]
MTVPPGRGPATSPQPPAPGGRSPSAAATWRNLRLLVGRARLRQGAGRVKVALVPVLVASVAAGVAYSIAHWPLGHPYPFFAPVAAWVCLGFTRDRQPRKVLELAIGVAIGVGLGDAVTHVIGSGAWQVALVLAVSALLARFIDRGPLLTTQAGVQAVVIVLLPPTPGAPASRFVDALVGGGVALAVAAFSPNDPRRRLSALAQEAVEELRETLDLLARSLQERDTDLARAALARGRASEPSLVEWRDAAASARDVARVNARARRHLAEVELAGQRVVLVDRVIRTVRVLSRRAVTLTGPDRETAVLGELVGLFAVAVRDLGTALSQGTDPVRARDELLTLAGRLEPRTVAADDWEVQALVLLVRSAVVDALEAAGVEPGAARDALPDL